MHTLRRFGSGWATSRVSVLAVYVGLAACARSPSEYTVDYYTAHPQEREAKLVQCANDPGALRNDALCVNARQAGLIDGIGSLRDLPPIGLLKGEERRRRERERQQEYDRQRQPH